jgi:hypothetical protein
MLDGKCAVTTFSWASNVNGNNNNNAISLFSKHVSFGKEKKFLGTAVQVGPSALQVEYPASRENIYS